MLGGMLHRAPVPIAWDALPARFASTPVLAGARQIAYGNTVIREE
jgi:hypothetical protein